MGAPPTLLDIDRLVVEFPGFHRQRFRALDEVSLRIGEGRTLGLVGESGSGKTTLGRAILGLTHVSGGSLRFGGLELGGGTRPGSRSAQGTDIQAVFQDPYSSLNPTRTIGQSLRQPLHGRSTGKEEAQAMVHEALGRVGLAAETASRYPREFSGGQRQRIAIARAIVTGPKLIVCDEPIASLDLSIQAHVINLLRDLQENLGLAYLFISHDLPVVSHISHDVVVLYRGRVMESGPADDVAANPRHPYTEALLMSSPVPDREAQRERRVHRKALARSSERTSAGCPFAPRCPLVEERCWTERPLDLPRAGGGTISCHVRGEEERLRSRPALPGAVG